LEGTLQITLFQPSCHGQGHLSPDQAAQSPGLVLAPARQLHRKKEKSEKTQLIWELLLLLFCIAEWEKLHWKCFYELKDKFEGVLQLYLRADAFVCSSLCQEITESDLLLSWTLLEI